MKNLELIGIYKSEKIYSFKKTPGTSSTEKSAWHLKAWYYFTKFIFLKSENLLSTFS